MDEILFTFLMSLSIVVVIAFLVAVIRQIIIGKGTTSTPVSGSDNHVMKEHTGKYSVCKNIGEANAEF